ncbi:MAG TPA: uracil-DNA glycosylase family protein [Solirubrobacteraceae bacterium]
MPQPFDSGYVDEPFATLAADFPGPDVYPPADFRVEWGPIFHRGRVDGSARVLILGQDPGPHESAARRILVGEAGQRVQGLLAKLGIERSYVAVNTFLYSVYGQSGGERHADDDAIAAYRHRWLDALVATGGVEAVIAFGHLADRAFGAWRATPASAAFAGHYEHLTHPTQPEASSHDPATQAAAMATMLAQYNDALPRLHAAIAHPDVDRPLVPYGDALTDADHAEIPADDLPAGIPAWMRSLEGWAQRAGTDDEDKRATLVIQVPDDQRPWHQA